MQLRIDRASLAHAISERVRLKAESDLRTLHDMSKAEINARLVEITPLIANWAPHGGEFSLDMWLILQRSNYAAIIFPGGWANYPAWFLHDMRALDLLYEWHMLNTLYYRR